MAKAGRSRVFRSGRMFSKSQERAGRWSMVAHEKLNHGRHHADIRR